MKTIHLKCGHNITVREWPSKTGLAKVRHHYKKFHPMRMKKMTRKSLATKRRRGLINPFDLSAGIEKLRSEYSKLSTFPMSHHSRFRALFSKADDKTIKILADAKIKFVSVMAINEMMRRGLIKNRCNPKSKKRLPPELVRLSRVKAIMKRHGLTAQAALRRARKHNPPGELIYDRLLEIHAQKQHGKFKGENFVHSFKTGTSAQVLGLNDGSLLIRSTKGKKLWKKFSYD